MHIPFIASSLVALTLLTLQPACASERDELASAQRMLIQVQNALERARVAAAQADPAEHGRFFSDYKRATTDLKTIHTGIGNYLEPSRAQPRDSQAVTGNYRRERP